MQTNFPEITYIVEGPIKQLWGDGRVVAVNVKLYMNIYRLWSLLQIFIDTAALQQLYCKNCIAQYVAQTKATYMLYRTHGPSGFTPAVFLHF